MEIKKFVPKEDLPAKERAISILLDMLDEVHERIKKQRDSKSTLFRHPPRIQQALSAVCNKRKQEGL